MTEKKGGSMMRDPEKEYENAMDVMMEMKARDEDTTDEDMTNKEAAKWIQIYIDEWNEDLNQMKGFGMCLNEKGKKMMKAIEMGRDVLKRKETHTCDSIGRSMAVDAVKRIAHMATLPDGDVVIRKSAVEYVLLHLPSAQPERR